MRTHTVKFSSWLAALALVVGGCSSAGGVTDESTGAGGRAGAAGDANSEGGAAGSVGSEGGNAGAAGSISVTGGGGGASGSGSTQSTCADAIGQPSNVGCEFWAVDLDNEPDIGISNAAAAPWALVLSNTGMTPAEVTIEQNDAPPGQPAQITVHKKLTINPGQLAGELMPSREVDGSVKPGIGEAPGTWVSSAAFRITATSPIVAYQFNTATNSFANDASLLLPINALGKSYRVLGWPTANPREIKLGDELPDNPSIPDRSYVTVVGVKPDTTVRVKATWRIKAGGPIALTQPGTVIEYKLQPFDVLNLESDEATDQELFSGKPLADFTGSIVESDKPVAVFVGNERAGASGGEGFNPPDSDPKDLGCCTDHLEEQLFPLASIGRKFIVTRSPIRSKGGFKEPDVLRFMGAAATTEVTTSLPAPNDRFTLAPGQMRQVSVVDDIIVTATEPVIIGQILVSQSYLSNALTGDPSLTIFPPTEQYRQDYLFLVPPSWTTNHVVISAPVDAAISIDDATPGDCVITPIGTLDGVAYESRRCPLAVGVHKMAGDKPFGIVAYGYGSAGSYAFPGGADVRPIYEPPPLIVID